MDNLRFASERNLLRFIDNERKLPEARVGISLRLNLADLFHENAVMANVRNSIVRDLDVFGVKF